MYYHAFTNSYATPGLACVVGDNQYPADWFALASAEDLASHGFQPIVNDGYPEDEALFFVTSVLEGPIRRFINTPKPTEMIDAVDSAKREEFMTIFRKLREQVLDRLSGIAGRATDRPDPAKNDPVLREACMVAAESLLSITDDLPTDHAGTITALTERYNVIALTAITDAPSLINAFAKVDQ